MGALRRTLPVTLHQPWSYRLPSVPALPPSNPCPRHLSSLALAPPRSLFIASSLTAQPEAVGGDWGGASAPSLRGAWWLVRQRVRYGGASRLAGAPAAPLTAGAGKPSQSKRRRVLSLWQPAGRPSCFSHWPRPSEAPLCPGAGAGRTMRPRSGVDLGSVWAQRVRQLEQRLRVSPAAGGESRGRGRWGKSRATPTRAAAAEREEGRGGAGPGGGARVTGSASARQPRPFLLKVRF